MARIFDGINNAYAKGTRTLVYRAKGQPYLVLHYASLWLISAGYRVVNINENTVRILW